MPCPTKLKRAMPEDDQPNDQTPKDHKPGDEKPEGAKPTPPKPFDLRQLSETMYQNMRAIGGGMMKYERPDHTLSPTALVGAAVERMLVSDQTRFNNRAHLLAAAALAMRRILVDHARTRGRIKRGGEARKVEWEDVIHAVSTQEDPSLLLSLDEAIEKLEAENERYGREIVMRVFGSLTNAEIAHVLDISESLVEKDWRYVRARLMSLVGAASS